MVHEGNTEFWKRQFLGEGLNGDHGNFASMGKTESADVVVDVNVVEVVEQAESQDGEWVKGKQVAAKKALQMIGVKLLKDSNETTPSSKKSRRKAS